MTCPAPCPDNPAVTCWLPAGHQGHHCAQIVGAIVVWRI